jgi:serine/threonine protein phosphatase 1
MHNTAQRLEHGIEQVAEAVATVVERRRASRYGVLRTPCRVWAVGAIFGEAGKLDTLRRRLVERLAPDDRVVVLGNVIGKGKAIRETVDTLLLLRREVMARRGADVVDFVMLRGGQEEMWHKLLQLQFAKAPSEVLSWMLEQGVGETIACYGGNVEEGMTACRQGAVAINRWTSTLREAQQHVPGHQDYMSALRHAAYTADGRLLFVSSGLDPTRPLDAQEDTFWWRAQGLSALEEPYFDCRLVVRGFDPKHGGVQIASHTASIDGGCGFGGNLAAACLTLDGELDELIEV